MFVRANVARLAQAAAAVNRNAFVMRPTMFFGAQVDMAKLKQLRAATGSPLGHCKTALSETDNDIEKSKEWLRKKGLAEAAKRSDRSATQGLIGLQEGSEFVTMVQFSCETDFVAKTDRFQDGLKAIVDTIHAQPSLHISGRQSDDSTILEQIVKTTKLVKSVDPDQSSQTMEDGIKFTASKT